MTSSRFTSVWSKYPSFSDFLYDFNCFGVPCDELRVIYDYVSLRDIPRLQRTINCGKKLLLSEKQLSEEELEDWIVEMSGGYSIFEENYIAWAHHLISVLETELKIKTGEIKLTKQEIEERKNLLKLYKDQVRFKKKYFYLCQLLYWVPNSVDVNDPLAVQEYLEFVSNVSTDAANDAIKDGERLLKLKRFLTDAISHELRRKFNSEEECKKFVSDLLQLLREELAKRAKD